MTKKLKLTSNLFLLIITSFTFSGIIVASNSENIQIQTLVQTDSPLFPNNNQDITVSYPFILMDGYDRNVTFSAEPQRIISVAPSVTEVIYAVGAGDKLVAVDPNSNYPSETESLPKISNFPDLDIETIILYNPDLVLGAGITSLDDISDLENLGITVFTLAPFDVSEVLDDIEKVGLITNNVDNANILKNSLQGRIDAVKQNASDLTYHPKIYLEYFPLYSYGKGTYGHDVIDLAGGTNIAENATVAYPKINNEEVITQNPDIIFYAQGPWTTTNSTTISNRTGWNAIDAVKYGRIYPINEDWISRGGPRIVDALEEIHSKVKLVVSSGKNTSNIISSFEWYFIFAIIPIASFVMVRRRLRS